MSLILIAAISTNHVIGNGNTIPWKSKSDMRHFRTTTMDHCVIMGRKTFDSMQGRVLPGRINVVVGRSLVEGERALFGEPDDGTRLIFMPNLDDAIEKTQSEFSDRKTFIIGGGEIYKQSIDRVDSLIISHMNREVEGDIHFPPIESSAWSAVDTQYYLDEGLTFTVVTYNRTIGD